MAVGSMLQHKRPKKSTPHDNETPPEEKANVIVFSPCMWTISREETAILMWTSLCCVAENEMFGDSAPTNQISKLIELISKLRFRGSVAYATPGRDSKGAGREEIQTEETPCGCKI
jgi:hypothetical protein